MVRWQYCEVENHQGRVSIRYLTEEGQGWESQEVAKRNVHNMAIVLARLGREGWEVIDIWSERAHSSYTAADFYTGAFLKRPLDSVE